ncbi:retrotransposon hot spot (RHS) protein [Trypanosoma cruzi]|nr:retrotransposon hot spot (RHS) protein [Trypanosoma cruzi]
MGSRFYPDSGDVEISGGKWERKSFLIMQAEARVVRLALSAFPAILPSTMDVWVDSTSLQGAANKGSSKSHAMTRGSCNGYVCFWTLAEYRHPLPTYGLQKTPPTVCHAVVFLQFRNWRKEWKLRRGAAVSCGWRTPKSATS